MVYTYLGQRFAPTTSWSNTFSQHNTVHATAQSSKRLDGFVVCLDKSIHLFINCLLSKNHTLFMGQKRHEDKRRCYHSQEWCGYERHHTVQRLID